MLKLAMAGLALALGAGYALPSFSQAKPETLVQQRQAAMILQGKYHYPIVPMAQGKRPFDAKIVQRNVAYLDVLTQLPWDGFVPATADVKPTRALPEIYKDSGKFQAAQERLRNEVTKLVAVTKSGDEAGTKAQILQVNNACNSCHDSFRRKQ